MRAILAFVSLLVGAGWPSVQPVSKTAYIADASAARFVLPIRSSAGVVIYTLACYGPAGQPSASDFVYDGDFECRLSEATGRGSAYSTLFTEDPNQARDWETRARFFGTELVSPCGRIPQFGRARDFLLRGMRVSLRIASPSFTNTNKLKSFTFKVSVRNDTAQAARGRIASSPTIAARWKQLRCKLDNSVTPHFGS